MYSLKWRGPVGLSLHFVATMATTMLQLLSSEATGSSDVIKPSARSGKQCELAGLLSSASTAAPSTAADDVADLGDLVAFAAAQPLACLTTRELSYEFTCHYSLHGHMCEQGC